MEVEHSVAKRNELEDEASFQFVTKVVSHFNNVTFSLHSTSLSDALSEFCTRKKKVVVLYFHNDENEYCNKFCASLMTPAVEEVLERNFFLLGWDINDKKYHNALESALNNNDISQAISFLQTKQPAAFFIVSINDVPHLQICLRIDKAVNDGVVLDAFCRAEKYLETEMLQESELLQITQDKGNANDFGSTKFQQLMGEMLGNRDYDSFDFDEYDYLKDKIGFALYGPPAATSGYEKKQLKNMERLLQIILEQSRPFAEYKDRVEISFFFNCTEPLPEEKLKRSKKYPDDYNPTTDIMPVPVFVLRKCRHVEHPCRVFIDDTGRVYDSWMTYLKKNKLHQCQMILPQNGRYTFDEDGEVLLEKHLSPACDLDVKALKVIDVAASVSGVASAGIVAAAAIPAITVAPAVLIAGLAVGVGTGVYAIGRSIYNLVDRSKHKETLSFANSEARGAYLNILAGSLGFVGAGANMAVSQLVMRGFNIGNGAKVAVNVIGVANIGASGVSIANSGIDVISQWYHEDQTPSLLTIVQLTSSILFFGNAVFNFKTAGMIVEETQANTLKSYQDSLRSNRHRKTFNKMTKDTIRVNNGDVVKGQADVIAYIRKVPNKDEVFAALTRSNKSMNNKGVKFSAAGGDIKMNGIPVDMADFISMSKTETNSFLNNLPASPPATPAQQGWIQQIWNNEFDNFQLDTQKMYMLQNAVGLFKQGTQKVIVQILSIVLGKITVEVKKYFQTKFPGFNYFIEFTHTILRFFRSFVDNLEEQYQNWKRTGDKQYYNSMFDRVDLEKAQRLIQFFEFIIETYYTNSVNIAEKIVSYCYAWFAKGITDDQLEGERQEKRRAHSAGTDIKKYKCNICSGFYCEPVPK